MPPEIRHIVNDSSHHGTAERLEATFIDGCKGRLFCLYVEGQAADSSCVIDTGQRRGAFTCSENLPAKSERHILLFIQPFGEEINQCRRLFSMIRCGLSESDMIVVQPDLFGTGDSEGRLDEANRDVWRDDLLRVIRHFDKTRSVEGDITRLSIVAVRAGCLLAADLIDLFNQHENTPVLENLIFIQPETQGKNIVNRLFRARIMSQRLAGNKTQTTQDLWALVDQGELVHAGGHALSAELCKSLETQTLHHTQTLSLATRQLWFNLKSRSNPPETDPDGLPTWEVRTLSSAPFWQSYTSEPDASLIDAVVDTLTGRS